MTMEIKDNEKNVICHALDVYLNDLKHEIGKTKNYEMKNNLHRERDILQNIVSNC
jgi:hypothetical protein